MSNAPFKVGVVRPGGLGSPSIRELNRLPETDLVAVLAYSPEKEGKDIGDLIGIDPIGVNATTDFDAFLASDATTVIFTARDYGGFEADEPIIRLFEAGKNVSPPSLCLSMGARWRCGGTASGRRRKRRRPLYGTGITPGFFNEKLAMLMTNVTNDVTHIHMQELFNAADMADSLDLLNLFGFGGPLEAAENNPAVETLAQNYLIQPIHYAADQLGITVERIERISQHATTSTDIETPVMTVKAGTVGLISFKWVGYADGKPFYTTEVFWYLGEAMRPSFATCDDFWTVTIEGRPSVRVSVESKASMLTGDKFLNGDMTSPGYYMTVVAMVQAIPTVEAAAPGIFVPAMPEGHGKRDMRD
ncbi:MAG: hypothetical protein P8Y58_09955 [Novosphingobium sp.]